MANFRAGEDVWINDRGETVKSKDRPRGGDWYPHYPQNRVTKKGKYTPYYGTTPWIKAANAAMSEAAKSNYQARQNR